MILYDNSYIRPITNNPQNIVERQNSEDTLTTIAEMKDEQYFTNEEYFAKLPDVPQTDYDLFVEWMKTRKIEESEKAVTTEKTPEEKIEDFKDTKSVSSEEEFLESEDFIEEIVKLEEIPVLLEPEPEIKIKVHETIISTNPFEDEIPTTLLSVTSSNLTASQTSLTPSQNSTSDIEGENSSAVKRPVTHTKGRAPEPPKIVDEKKKKSLLGYIPNIFRSQSPPANTFETDSMKETAI